MIWKNQSRTTHKYLPSQTNREDRFGAGAIIDDLQRSGWERSGDPVA